MGVMTQMTKGTVDKRIGERYPDVTSQGSGLVKISFSRVRRSLEDMCMKKGSYLLLQCYLKVRLCSRCTDRTYSECLGN